MIGSLLTFFVVGLVGLVALSILFAIVGLVFQTALALAGFVLFKVVPVVLVGYVVVRFLAPRSKRLAAKEGEWLNGG